MTWSYVRIAQIIYTAVNIFEGDNKFPIFYNLLTTSYWINVV